MTHEIKRGKQMNKRTEKPLSQNLTLNRIRMLDQKRNEYDANYEKCCKLNKQLAERENTTIALVNKICECFEELKLETTDKECLYLSLTTNIPPFCLSKNRIEILGENKRLSTPKKLVTYIINTYITCTDTKIQIPERSLPIYSELFTAFYNYIRCYPLPPYYAYLQKYVSSLYMGNFFYYIDHFICINENIYIFCLFNTAHPTLTLFSKKIMLFDNSFFNPNDVIPPAHFLKGFYRQLSALISNNGNQIITRKDYPNHSFSLKISNNVFDVKFSNNKADVIPNAISPSLCTYSHYSQEQLHLLNTPLSEPSLNFLYTLSSGSIERFHEICSLFALLCTNQYYSLKRSKRALFIITGSISTINIFKSILEKCGLSSPVFNGTNTICKNSSLNLISQYLFKNIKYIAVTLSDPKDTPRQQEIILSLIKGNRIKCYNDIRFPVVLKNNLPIICFSDSQKNIRSSMQSYPSKLISLDFNAESLNELMQHSVIDFQIISTYLSLYGLFYLQSDSQNNKGKKVRAANNDYTEEFISKYCYPSENSHLFFDDLHNAYMKYCRQQSGSVPLSYIKFNKIMKQNFEYKRPHTTKDDNRWAYTNIAFDEESFSNFFQTPTVNVDASYIDFKNTLLENQKYLSDLLNEGLHAFIPSQTQRTVFYELLNKS